MDIPRTTRGAVIHQRNASSAARRYRAHSRGCVVLDGQSPSCVVVELERGGISQRGCVRQPECMSTSAYQLLIEVRSCRQYGYAARSCNGLQTLTQAVDGDVFICITQNNRVGARRSSYARAAICHANSRALPCSRRYCPKRRYIPTAIKVD